MTRIAALEVELQQDLDHVQRLFGAQDERNALLKALMPKKAGNSEGLVALFGTSGGQALAVDDVNAGH